MRVLELKVPPLAVFLIAGALMWAISRATPALRFVVPNRHVIAAVLALTGLCVGLVGVGSFRRARTTVNPMSPASASSLVTSGIYRVSRNPMYLGLLVVLTAWAILLSNALSFAGLPAFILYMNRFQIEPEERALELLFGGDFAAYKARVRRWL